jgi:transcriptional regulator with XRE-family HTH domain
MTHTPTPGGNRLRALREYAGRTQLDVELDANLGSGYLQRVESGKVRHPEQDTLERILAALGARYTERRDVLELFGYLVDAPLPNSDEIQWAIEACKAELHSAVFPAYLLDCAHTMVAWNRFTPKIYKTDKLNISMLRILFDPVHKVMPLIANPEEFFPAQIRALRYEMRSFRNERWHGTLINDMMGCETFAHYWTQSETAQAFYIPARPLVPLELRLPDVGLLQFRVVSESFAQDRRFRVIYCLPAEPRTIQQCLTWLDDGA